MPFYLHGLTDTSEIKLLISHIRDLSVRFEARGLPNYPSGNIFISKICLILIYHQYIYLLF